MWQLGAGNGRDKGGRWLSDVHARWQPCAGHTSQARAMWGVNTELVRSGRSYSAGRLGSCAGLVLHSRWSPFGDHLLKLDRYTVYHMRKLGEPRAAHIGESEVLICIEQVPSPFARGQVGAEMAVTPSC